MFSAAGIILIGGILAFCCWMYSPIGNWFDHTHWYKTPRQYQNNTHTMKVIIKAM